MKVLIVEDNEEDQKAIARFLAKFGVDTHCIATLDQAWEQDAKHEWDLIILDGHLSDAKPLASGFFADVARNAILIITGEPETFADVKFRRPIKILNKANMEEIVRETLGFLKKQLA